MFKLKNIQVSSANRPEDYVINDPALSEAVNMSIWLQKPLLLTGAPGTGKTQLAYKVAQELSSATNQKGFANFLRTPFIFNTKTTSSASDLFYYYDAVGHFQKRNIISSSEKSSSGSDEISPHAFIQLNALGEAILQSFGKTLLSNNRNLKELSRLNKFDTSIGDLPASSVVLIDEIDKAPRDFPNDLLNEIENYEFRIQELNKTIKKDRNQDPFPAIVVIMTSNFEKNLPDAFLRRCLFYHIPSPDNETLYKIVASRMTPYLKEMYTGEAMLTDEQISAKLKQFNKTVDEFAILKEKFKDKKPATSELLEWIKVLELNNFFNGETDFRKLTDDQKTILRFSLPILAKTKDDLDLIKKEI